MTDTNPRIAAEDAQDPNAQSSADQQTHGNGMGFALGAGQFGQPGDVPNETPETPARDETAGRQLGQPGSMPDSPESESADARVQN